MFLSISQQPTSPTTPTKPVVPLEWASGVVPKPDPTVINKHIRKLVDVSIWNNVLVKEIDSFGIVVMIMNFKLFKRL